VIQSDGTPDLLVHFGKALSHPMQAAHRRLLEQQGHAAVEQDPARLRGTTESLHTVSTWLAEFHAWTHAAGPTADQLPRQHPIITAAP
jgi:hypothetical protein